MTEAVAALAEAHQGAAGIAPRPNTAEAQARELTPILIRMENRLLEQLRRLHAAEHGLASMLGRKQEREGRRAVRQVEFERQRIGRELHTGVGQMLAAIRIQLEIVDQNLSSPPGPVYQALQRISALSEEALDQVRSVSRGLQPPRWQRLSLEAALRQLWEMSGVASRFEGEVRIQPLPFEPDLAVKGLFYRAAQEALSNIMRHSQASRIQLILRQVRDLLVLQVRDNGTGFDATRVFREPGTGAGIGLVLMRDQARSLGGKLLVKSSRHGTTLEVSIGFSQAAARKY